MADGNGASRASTGGEVRYRCEPFPDGLRCLGVRAAWLADEDIAVVDSRLPCREQLSAAIEATVAGLQMARHHLHI